MAYYAGAKKRKYGGIDSRNYKKSRTQKKKLQKAMTRYGGFPSIRYAGMRPEKKSFDTQTAAANIGTAGAIKQSTLMAIAQGNAENQRIGRKIRVTDIHMNILITIASGTNLDAGAVVRVILAQDRQCNGTTISWSQLVQLGGPMRFRTLEETMRLRTLKDSLVVVEPLSAAGNGTTDNTVGRKKLLKWHIKCNIPIMFDNAAGALASLTSNNVLLAAQCDQGTGITLEAETRIRYYDA